MSPRPYRLGQLLSFETFDTLAGPTRSLEEVAPLVYRLARAAIGLNEEQLSKSNRSSRNAPNSYR